jgi:hypothetical protein
MSSAPDIAIRVVGHSERTKTLMNGNLQGVSAEVTDHPRCMCMCYVSIDDKEGEVRGMAGLDRSTEGDGRPSARTGRPYTALGWYDSRAYMAIGEGTSGTMVLHASIIVWPCRTVTHGGLLSRWVLPGLLDGQTYRGA